MSLSAKTLTSAAALLAVLSLSACGSGTSFGLTKTENDQRSYTVAQKLTGLRVTGHTGKVEIVGADVSAVSVTEKLRFTDNGHPNARHQVTGGVLELTYSCPGSISLSGRTCEVDYRVTVPRALTAELRTDTGDITASGLTGSVTARANTGTITGTALRPAASAHVTARTDTGSIRLSLGTAPADVNAHANTGQIRILVPSTGQYAVTADTNTGKKKITVPTSSSAPHTIQARTDTGDVTIASA
ncbi:DUF4097 family beta strand repeat-containing protein [Actinomadura oligospora]|uniref:DUF4097 family beta strand repeat-containing protein n=1 Tax=Actinomadura oligospora TaxID=111804 RepID=UPI00047C38C7|nr:DUF4097 family beta strand repeat-containing protein [Actinomadura oligospora]